MPHGENTHAHKPTAGGGHTRRGLRCSASSIASLWIRARSQIAALSRLSSLRRKMSCYSALTFDEFFRAYSWHARCCSASGSALPAGGPGPGRWTRATKSVRGAVFAQERDKDCVFCPASRCAGARPLDTGGAISAPLLLLQRQGDGVDAVPQIGRGVLALAREDVVSQPIDASGVTLALHPLTSRKLSRHMHHHLLVLAAARSQVEGESGGKTAVGLEAGEEPFQLLLEFRPRLGEIQRGSDVANRCSMASLSRTAPADGDNPGGWP